MAVRTHDHPDIYRRVPGATHGIHRPQAVVIHCTQSRNVPGVADVLAIPNFWRQQGKGYNAHLVIDGKGNTVKCALDNQICWAVAGSNTGRLHIEFIGFAEYTADQWKRCDVGLKQGAKWAAYWCERHAIPIRHSVNFGIATHADYSNAFHISDHQDPGIHFPFDQFLRRVRYYHVNGWLTAPNV